MQLQGQVRYDGIHASTFPRYFAATLSAPQAARGLRLLQGFSDLDGPCRRRYVDGPYPIGTGPSPAARAVRLPPSRPRSRSVDVPDGGSDAGPGP